MGELYEKPFGDLIINGGFDVDANWDKQADWTIAGGQADCTWALLSETYRLRQYPVLANGTQYIITYSVPSISIANWSALRFSLGNDSDPRFGPEIRSPGNFAQVFEAGADAFVYFYIINTWSGPGTLKLDNVSLWNYEEWLADPYHLDITDFTKFEYWDLGGGEDMILMANNRTPTNVLIKREP